MPPGLGGVEASPLFPRQAALALALLLPALLAGCTELPAAATEAVEPALPEPLATAGQAADARPPNATAAPTKVAARPPGALVPDPLLPGPLGVVRHAYDFGTVAHANQARASVYLLPLRGSIHVPETGEGPFPVVLLQHGRHGTCGVLGETVVVSAAGIVLGPAGQCPRAQPVVGPIDSYAGYDYVAENLASHGYVVASVDANAVNDLDGLWAFTGTNRDAGAEARADVLLRTLDKLAALHDAPDDPDWGGVLAGRLDLQRVGLMGHSRGGEGVTHALHANLARPEAERHALRAVFALAPIDATGTSAPGVAFVTLLPYCDGDVRSLSGARIYDDSRGLTGHPRTQILVMGANHNYYNTAWPQDDARWYDDAACGPDAAARLAPEAQRAEGLAHVAAFFRLHLGGETGYAPLFDGTATLPATACPGGAPCPGLVHVSRADPGALVLPGGKGAGFASSASCAPPECESGARVVGSAERVVLSWKGPATYAIPIPPEGADARAFSAFVFRAGVDPAAAENKGLDAQDVRVTLVDATGATATARASDWSRALFVPPGGPDTRKVVLNDVRIPLHAFSGIDLGALREARLVFDATPAGRLHVSDAALVP